MWQGKKARSNYDSQINGSIPYLLIDGIKSRSFTHTDDKDVVIAKEDDSLMVMDGASSGMTFIGFGGAVGSTLGIFRSMKNSAASPYYIYLLLKSNFAAIAEKNVGSAIPHANKDYIATLKVIVPKLSDIMVSFHNTAENLFKQVVALEQKNVILRKTRDLLLPKLISGEIDVEALDIKTKGLEA